MALQALLSSLNSPEKKNGVGNLSLLQGIFLTQGLNVGLIHTGTPESQGSLILYNRCFMIHWHLPQTEHSTRHIVDLNEYLSIDSFLLTINRKLPFGILCINENLLR